MTENKQRKIIVHPVKYLLFLRYQLSCWLREQKISVHLVKYLLFLEQIIILSGTIIVRRGLVDSRTFFIAYFTKYLVYNISFA